MRATDRSTFTANRRLGRGLITLLAALVGLIALALPAAAADKGEVRADVTADPALVNHPALASLPDGFSLDAFVFTDGWASVNGLAPGIDPDDDGDGIPTRVYRLTNGHSGPAGFLVRSDPDGDSFGPSGRYVYDDEPPAPPTPVALAGDPIPVIDITINQSPGGKGVKMPTGGGSVEADVTTNLYLRIPGPAINDLVNDGSIDLAAYDLPGLDADGDPDSFSADQQLNCVIDGVELDLDTAGSGDFGLSSDPVVRSGAPFLNGEGALYGEFDGVPATQARSVSDVIDPAVDLCPDAAKELLMKNSGDTVFAGQVWLDGFHAGFRAVAPFDAGAVRDAVTAEINGDRKGYGLYDMPGNHSLAAFVFTDARMRVNAIGDHDLNSDGLPDLIYAGMNGHSRPSGFLVETDADGNFVGASRTYTHDDKAPDPPVITPVARPGDPIPDIDITINQSPGGKVAKDSAGLKAPPAPQGAAEMHGGLSLLLPIPAARINDLDRDGRLDLAGYPYIDSDGDGFGQELPAGARLNCLIDGVQIDLDSAGSGDFGLPGLPAVRGGAPFTDAEGALYGEFIGVPAGQVRSAAAGIDPDNDLCTDAVRELLDEAGETGLSGRVWLDGFHLGFRPARSILARPKPVKKRVRVKRKGVSKLRLRIPNTGEKLLTVTAKVKSNRRWLRAAVRKQLRVAPGKAGNLVLRLKVRPKPARKANRKPARVVLRIRGAGRVFRAVVRVTSPALPGAMVADLKKLADELVNAS